MMMASRKSMTNAIMRLRTVVDSKSSPDVQTSYSVQFIMQMLYMAIAQGASLPHALILVGQCLEGVSARALIDIGQSISSGVPWGYAWKTYGVGLPYKTAIQRVRAACGVYATVRADDARELYALIVSIHDALEASWVRGSSALLRISTVVDALNDKQDQAIVIAGNTLSVKVLVPLGLCFLPGFIVLSVVPLLSAWGVFIA